MEGTLLKRLFQLYMLFCSILLVTAHILRWMLLVCSRIGGSVWYCSYHDFAQTPNQLKLRCLPARCAVSSLLLQQQLLLKCCVWHLMLSPCGKQQAG